VAAQLQPLLVALEVPETVAGLEDQKVGALDDCERVERSFRSPDRELSIGAGHDFLRVEVAAARVPADAAVTFIPHGEDHDTLERLLGVGVDNGSSPGALARRFEGGGHGTGHQQNKDGEESSGHLLLRISCSYP